MNKSNSKTHWKMNLDQDVRTRTKSEQNQNQEPKQNQHQASIIEGKISSLYWSIWHEPDQWLQMRLHWFQMNKNRPISWSNKRESRHAPGAVHQLYILVFLGKIWKQNNSFLNDFCHKYLQTTPKLKLICTKAQIFFLNFNHVHKPECIILHSNLVLFCQCEKNKSVCNSNYAEQTFWVQAFFSQKHMGAPLRKTPIKCFYKN